MMAIDIIIDIIIGGSIAFGVIGILTVIFCDDAFLDD